MPGGSDDLQAKRRKGKDPWLKKSPIESEAVCAMMDKALTKIKAIDTTAWPEAGKASFATILIS